MDIIKNHEHKTERVTMERADEIRGLYFPLASETGLRSAITPDLSGDAKLDQNHFLLEPASIEDLSEKSVSRNFWVTKSVALFGKKTKMPESPQTGESVNQLKTHFSITGHSAAQLSERMTSPDTAVHTTLTAGYMWQRIERCEQDIKSCITSFIPDHANTEVHMIALENVGREEIEVTLTAAIPIYGRSADNLRDHRHVTSLLNRTEFREQGIFMTPTMSFDERGHQLNEVTYFVAGFGQHGEVPAAFYPDMDHFAGEGGSLLAPEVIYREAAGISYAAAVKEHGAFQGREVMGGLQFAPITLAPGECACFQVLTGVGQNIEEAEKLSFCARTYQDASVLLEATRRYWREKVKISVHTGDPNFDQFMRWVAFQPELRRVFGCSFLPHHDYGRGGRGWRDLWQDCLALLLMDPGAVREQLVANAGGFRIDGTNATIIGEALGQFKADRNGIARIWMDHGFWPYLTSALYYDMTGDKDFWLEQVPYFSDTEEDFILKTPEGDIYYSTFIEHLLLATLREYLDVGEHGMIRLRGADWNDALDLATERGESVAFTHAYAMNLRSMSNRLEEFVGDKLKISNTLWQLLDMNAVSIEERHEGFSRLEDAVHSFTGEKIIVDTKWVMASLQKKADYLEALLREREWMELVSKKNGERGHLFRSYYDGDGTPVESAMLTGQVFSVMSGIATEDMVDEIIQSVEEHLTDPQVGGVRLNEDLGGIRMNLGRMTGFAFGTKENGAVFSHMSVMYANALLRRGRVDAGFSVLSMLYKQAMDSETSKMLPGIPEYFDPEGRGVYTYLTGAASWYLYTVVCELFGVHFKSGAVSVNPQIPDALFGNKSEVSITLPIKGELKTLHVSKDMSYFFEA